MSVAEIDHFSYGIVTPAVAYLLSVLGSLLGLVCTARARAAATTRRRAWYLLLAAWAIGGTGIWVMHFIAMLGFGVSGSQIRYDVTITAASAVIAIVVVGIGLFTVGTGRPHLIKIILGGVFAGLGVAAMHYTGMYAMRINGTVLYDNRLVGASIAIAVVAATVALWFTVVLQRSAAIFGASLVMGVAVCGMHYTGMYAMEVHVHDSNAQLTGSTAFALILPIVLLVIFVVMGLIYAVLAAPTDDDLAGAAYVHSRQADRGQRVPPAPAPALAPPAPPPAMPRANGHAFPTQRRQSIPRATRRTPPGQSG